MAKNKHNCHTWFQDGVKCAKCAHLLLKADITSIADLAEISKTHNSEILRLLKENKKLKIKLAKRWKK